MLQKLFRHPWIIIAVILAGTLFFSLQIPKTRIDNDITKFVPERYPSRLAFEEVEEIFGSQDHVSIAFQSLDGTIFTERAISYIDEVTKRIEDLDYVYEVNSLTNADYISGTAEGMEVTPLVEDFTGTPDEIQELETRLISWDAYRKLLFSEDFQAAQIIATLEKDLDVEVWEQAYYEIKEIVTDSEDYGLKAHVAGNPVMTALMGTSVRGDLRNLHRRRCPASHHGKYQHHMDHRYHGTLRARAHHAGHGNPGAAHRCGERLRYTHHQPLLR